MAGYSQKPLFRKLGLKDGMNAAFINAPVEYLGWLSFEGEIPSEIADEPLDFVHLFAPSFAELDACFPDLAGRLSPAGALWVSWYKRSSKIPTDIDENAVREYGLRSGLVDVKVCAVSEEWSGLKFVRRLSDRKY